MVAQVFTDREERYEQTLDIYTLLGEPGEDNAIWGDIKIAQLQAFDYLYVSSKINSKLTGKNALQSFLIDVFQLTETDATRVKIYLYMDKAMGSPEFVELEIHWAGNKIREFNMLTIDNPKHKEFIRTMYEYSSSMFETIGHC